jgi:prepilin-type N-terminal cleavage/methylation domain-containing protein/prepilin-type processing-associated H-X9-DG protein
VKNGKHNLGRIGLHSSGFTLIELLIVVAVIATLIAILTPTIALMRNQARITQCASNLRQIAMGLQAYATSSGDMYPPNMNSAAPGQYWYDARRAGRFLGDNLRTAMGTPGGGVLICPADPGAERSYSMNLWASGTIDPYYLSSSPPRGRLWRASSSGAASLILVTEAWSYLGSENWGWFAPPTIGYAGTSAGVRFGAGSGITPPMSAGRWGMVNSELSFMRHRPLHTSATGTLPQGQINIAYADGHVQLRSNDDLVSGTTGMSTGDSAWYPGDTGK